MLAIYKVKERLIKKPLLHIGMRFAFCVQINKARILMLSLLLKATEKLFNKECELSAIFSFIITTSIICPRAKYLNKKTKSAHITQTKQNSNIVNKFCRSNTSPSLTKLAVIPLGS
jgi:hypothetical protein